MDRIAARLVAEHADLDLGRGLAPFSLQAGPRYRLSGGVLVGLDCRLGPMRSRECRLGEGTGLLAATVDLAVVVGGGRGDLVIDIIEHDDVIRLAIPGADSATFVGSDRLVVTAPLVEIPTWQGETYEANGCHRVVLIEPSTGTLVDEAILDVSDAGVSATPHPTDGSLLLDAGEGQDGSYLFAARVASDRFTVERVGDNVVAAGFSPAGDRVLLTPHPSFDNEVVVASWPSLEHLTTIMAGRLDVDDAFDFYGCFLDDDSVLLKTYDHGAVLCDGDLHPRAWIDLDPAGRFAGSDLGTLLGTGSGLFAASLWINGSDHTTVWNVDPQPLADHDQEPPGHQPT